MCVCIQITYVCIYKYIYMCVWICDTVCTCNSCVCVCVTFVLLWLWLACLYRDLDSLWFLFEGTFVENPRDASLKLLDIRSFGNQWTGSGLNCAFMFSRGIGSDKSLYAVHNLVDKGQNQLNIEKRVFINISCCYIFGKNRPKDTVCSCLFPLLRGRA